MRRDQSGRLFKNCFVSEEEAVKSRSWRLISFDYRFNTSDGFTTTPGRRPSSANPATKDGKIGAFFFFGNFATATVELKK